MAAQDAAVAPGRAGEGERGAHILPLIVVAQFLGTSLWFVPNAITAELEQLWPELGGITSLLTSSVQLGFIAGTAIFALTALTDRFAAHRLFAACAAVGALCNGLTLAAAGDPLAFAALRFLTGFSLAGVYPVGMKLAASWFGRDLGRAIGLLVGALVVGTAFPHLLRTLSLPWRPVIATASGLATLGGLLVLGFVPQGPNVARSARLQLREVPQLLRHRDYLRASLGYFGHMWELYAVFAFVPLAIRPLVDPASLSTWSFAFIAVGAVGCALGGEWSRRVGGAAVSFVFLAVSGACCLLSPWLLSGSGVWTVLFLLVWGIAVAGDSPQFSAVAAQAVPPHLVGSALALMTAIGFAVSIASLLLVGFLSQALSARYWFVALTPGPALGLLALLPLVRSQSLERRSVAA